MQRRTLLVALVSGLGCWGTASPVQAETLFSLSGQVAMADGLTPAGVKVKLQLDLDRNGKLESYETLNATVAQDGSYALNYDLDPADVDLKFLQFVGKLVASYQARGFDALLDGGPLPVLLTFEREGYSSIVKRVTTFFQTPNLDVTLTPLNDIQCTSGSCLSPDGGVRLSGFPGGTGIARAYADSYDPGQETARFPGLFTDSANNLLISSGFAEVNLYAEDGKAIHSVSSAVSVRFEAKQPSWRTLPDLEPNSGRIELPMYSFDQVTGEWIAEANGELQLADGSVVSEDELVAIHDETFEQPLYVAFETKHFSTFNCDAPIEERACVKGKLVASAGGVALAGVQVSVEGVSYTGNAGAVFTGADGTFAMDVMKSELPSEDIDRNQKQGEVFEARVVATGTGVYVSAAFQTPTDQASVGRASRPTCKPEACECVDLGEFVVEFEEPRLCEISIESVFSGKHLTGSGGPLSKGDALVGATVRGQLSGGLQLPQAAVAALCEGTTCSPLVVPSDGLVTFAVPVVGDAPEIQIDASLSSNVEGSLHYYSGSVVVAACTREQTSIDATVVLALDHAELGGLGDFIQALGPLVKPPVINNPASGQAGDEPGPRRGCGCRQAGASESRGATWGSLSGALGLLLLTTRRRRQRGRGSAR